MAAKPVEHKTVQTRILAYALGDRLDLRAAVRGRPAAHGVA